MKHAQPLQHAAATSGGGGSDRIKLIVAIVLLAIAGGTLAWYFGLFGGKPTSSTRSSNTSGQNTSEQGTTGKGDLRAPKEEPRGGPRMGDG
ncbi:MAG: hypothetical protein H6811_04755 [Phycisphaeraceae bacterium]|nr:hypothetical protein [Phycisphaeraceae bacterium]